MSSTAGSRNETGFVNSLNRQGFTHTKCGSELISNSIDAFATNIIFDINEERIIMIDDGIGMTEEKLIYMFDANRENHNQDQSMGVSGIGGIISNFQFSKDRNENPRVVVVYTKNVTGHHVKATVPWDEIFNNKKYDNQISISKMDECEIEVFNSERNFMKDNKTGTTIKFCYSDKINNLMKKQFVNQYVRNIDMSDNSDSDNSTFINIDDWWSVIFGKKTNVNIVYKLNDGRPPRTLVKYDYFSGSDIEYYCGKTLIVIYHFRENGHDRFICKNPNNINEYIEIEKFGNNRFRTEPTSCRISESKLSQANVLTITFGMRKNNLLFDVNKPKDPKGIDATFRANEYDEQFMLSDKNIDNLKQFYSKTPIYRNEQYITFFDIDRKSSSISRGNGASMLETIYHRSEISYKTYSSQDNFIDNIFGIQQNKNQNQREYPEQLIRLLKYLKKNDYKRHINYFTEVYENHIREIKEARQKKEEEERQIRIAQEEEARLRRLAQEEEARLRRLAQEEEARLRRLAKKEEERLRRIAEEEALAKEEEIKKMNQEDIDAYKTPINNKILSDDDNTSSILDDDEILNDNKSSEDDASSSVSDDVSSTKSIHDASDDDDDFTNRIDQSRDWIRATHDKITAYLIHVNNENYNRTDGEDLFKLVNDYILRNSL